MVPQSLIPKLKIAHNSPWVLLPYGDMETQMAEAWQGIFWVKPRTFPQDLRAQNGKQIAQGRPEGLAR